MSHPTQTEVIDFSRLRHLLSGCQWKLADEETRSLMCRIAGREEALHLVPQAVAVFPCESLRLIDALWVASSHGRFGFSAQRGLWVECGGDGKIHDYYEMGESGKSLLGQIETRFAAMAGWTREGPYADAHLANLTFGHLPYSCLMCSYGRGLVGLVLSAIVWRLKNCDERSASSSAT
jgi:hypothetical protein